MIGKKTWNSTQASKGYSNVSAPKFEPAWESKFEGNRAKQSVKGKHGKKAPAEAAPVAGRKQ